MGRLTDVDPMAMGPTLTPYEYRPAPFTELIGLAIHPEWVSRLLDRNVAEIARDHVWPDPDPLLEDALRLAEQGAQPEAVAAAIGRAALTRLADMPAPEPRLRIAMGLVRRTSGRVRVGAIADRLDISERQLRRAMHAAIGLAPKSYAKIVRFNAIMAQADRKPSPDWSGLAADFGYSDQAHLVREARALAGGTPAMLHGERQAESVFFNHSI